MLLPARQGRLGLFTSSGYHLQDKETPLTIYAPFCLGSVVHCVFWRGFNTQNSSCNEMVQCLTCFAWYHRVGWAITFRRGQGFHHSGLWLHVAPPISEPRHVSVQWNPYFSNLLITRTLEILFPFPQSNTVTLPRFLKLPYYLNKVLFILNFP